jgi:hypothetical protein
MVSYLLSRGAAPRLPDDPPWAAPIAWAKRRGTELWSNYSNVDPTAARG